MRSSRRTMRATRAARRSLQRTCARGTARLCIAPLGWIGPRCAAHAVGEAHVPQCAATAAPLRSAQPRGGRASLCVGAAKRCAAQVRRGGGAPSSAPGRSDSARLTTECTAAHSLTVGFALRGNSEQCAAAGAPSARPARAVRTHPPSEGNRTRLSHSVQRAVVAQLSAQRVRPAADRAQTTAQRTPPRSRDISPAHRRTRRRWHCAAARAWSIAGCACRRSARRHRGAPPAVRVVPCAAGSACAYVPCAASSAWACVPCAAGSA